MAKETKSSEVAEMTVIGNVEGILHLDAQVPHRALELRVPEQESEELDLEEN